MLKILHVTPHLGGGIGTVLSGVCINDRLNKHSVLCLEETLTPQYYNKCIASGVAIYFIRQLDILNFLTDFDVVQIEWWHHPLTAEWMVKNLGKVALRLVVWSHISGCNYPRIPYNFVKMADRFIFATKYSYDNPSWSEAERLDVINNTDLVVSSGNRFDFQVPPKKEHTSFNVGYVGFLGYEKTHPNFVEICETCKDIEDVRFIVVGDLSHGQELVKDAEASSLADKFVFKGYTNNIWQELAEFDVFACLLQKHHTGTAENALLEAMYSKTCVVVLKQCSEQYTVTDNVTGLVCESEHDFSAAVRELYNDSEKRQRLAENASKFVAENLCLGNTIEGLTNVYAEVMRQNKTTHDALSVFGESAADWFLACYVDDLERITGLANGASKSSINQYYKYFKDSRLEAIIEENKK